jgi:alanyl-tRNA synthetase
VRQAGSYVGPDKLRFDFTHAQRLSPEELRDVEDQVNAWVSGHHPVRALTTTLTEARRLGAMALFGEKYGEVVRMVEVGDGSFSRELCGGTHARTTAEVGVFKILSESSSAANVRRIEAITGPEAVRLLRERDDALSQIAARLRTRPEDAGRAVESKLEQAESLEVMLKAGGADQVKELAGGLADQAADIGGLRVVTAACEVSGNEELLELADRLKSSLENAAIVLGSAGNGRPVLVASFTPAAVERGLSAAAVVKEAAAVMGGGGGGRDTMAQAGGRDPEKLGEALETARRAIEAKLGEQA